MTALKEKIEEAIEATPTGVSFVHIKGYENSKGEIADVLINVGVNYQKQLEKDVNTLKELDTSSIEVPEDAGFDKVELETARNELLARLIAPDKKTQNRSKGQADAYENIAPGVRRHKESGTLYIWGKKVKKTVHQKGDYGEDRRKSLTKAKDFIRNKYLGSSQFRQFKVEPSSNTKFSGSTAEELVIVK